MNSAAKFQQWLQEAVAHHRAGRLTRAEALYRQLAALAPQQAAIFERWGQLAQQQSRTEEAIRLLTQAFRLDERGVGCGLRLASVLVKAGRAVEAEQWMRRLTATLPGSAEGWGALGFTLKVQGQLAAAIAAQERAVTLAPKSADLRCQLGLTLGSAGKNFLALQQHDRALAIDPRHAQARYGRAQALHKIYRIEEAIADYETFLQAEPRHHAARSSWLLARQTLASTTREQLFAAHRTYGQAVGAGPAALTGYDLSPDRRLRLAILSPDLRRHSCAYFIEPLLRHLDGQQFELYLYHDHFLEDEVSTRLRAGAVVWRNFVGQPDAAVERAIRADRPDVLVDLSGHIGNTVRLPILARRLAPVQVTYLGYPDTTGVSAMDFRCTDAIADPPGEADRLATEQLVRFAPCAWSYQPPADAPRVVPPPAAAAPKGVVTFGCFSCPSKFTGALFEAWGELLGRLSHARLLLKGRDFDETEVREHLLRRMGAAGVPLERVALLPRTADTASHLARYGDIDVALDTFPYVGTTTTCEALWMGRPVVTLCGDRHAARVGASLLTAVGRPEWIARDAGEYVRIATTLALEPAPLAAASAGLRGQMEASPLLDHAGQAARWMSALRQCWKVRVASETGSRDRV